MSPRTRALTTAVAVALAPLVAACGGDDGGPAERPAASELSIKFRNEISMTPAQADCTAEVLVGSDISDATLADVNDADLDRDNPDIFRGVDLTDDDREALGSVAQDLGACVGVAPTTAPPASTPSGTDPGGSAPATEPGTASTAPATSAPAGSPTTAG